ncbi:hypothetical protein CHU98_g8310 [Xylaria longipes]|nr:hypothetical protein CHU98_g8310 [Xylaria longipes]
MLVYELLPDVEFDEESFYDKDERKAIKLSRAKIEPLRVFEELPLDISEILNVWEQARDTIHESNTNTPENEGSVPDLSGELSVAQQEEQEFGVGASSEPVKGQSEAHRDWPHGLMTPLKTLESEGQQLDVEGNFSTQQEGDSTRTSAPDAHKDGAIEDSQGADPLSRGAHSAPQTNSGAQPAKRKYERKQHPPASRSSRRIRGQEPEKAGNPRKIAIRLSLPQWQNAYEEYKWLRDEKALKFNEEGFLKITKARVVVRGDLQQDDSLQSTYASTLAAKTFRLIMAIAAHFDMEVKLFDVVTAFLNATRENEPPVTVKSTRRVLPRQHGWTTKASFVLALRLALTLVQGVRESPRN